MQPRSASRLDLARSSSPETVRSHPRTPSKLQPAKLSRPSAVSSRIYTHTQRPTPPRLQRHKESNMIPGSSSIRPAKTYSAVCQPNSALSSTVETASTSKSNGRIASASLRFISPLSPPTLPSNSSLPTSHYPEPTAGPILKSIKRRAKYRRLEGYYSSSDEPGEEGVRRMASNRRRSENIVGNNGIPHTCLPLYFADLSH